MPPKMDARIMNINRTPLDELGEEGGGYCHIPSGLRTAGWARRRLRPAQAHVNEDHGEPCRDFLKPRKTAAFPTVC